MLTVPVAADDMSRDFLMDEHDAMEFRDDIRDFSHGPLYRADNENEMNPYPLTSAWHLRVDPLTC